MSVRNVKPHEVVNDNILNELFLLNMFTQNELIPLQVKDKRLNPYE